MTIYSGFSHEKLWFSIAMLVYQRVIICHSISGWWFQPKKNMEIFKQIFETTNQICHSISISQSFISMDHIYIIYIHIYIYIYIHIYIPNRYPLQKSPSINPFFNWRTHRRRNRRAPKDRCSHDDPDCKMWPWITTDGSRLRNKPWIYHKLFMRFIMNPKWSTEVI